MNIQRVVQLIVVMLLWALCFPLITAGIASAPHLSFAAMRAFLAGAGLIAFGFALRRPLPKGGRVWSLLLLVGLSATSLGFFGMFHAAEFVAPGIATVIANTQPLLAAILAHVILGEHLAARGKVGLLLGFCGIVVITMPRLLSGSEESYPIGFAYITLAALGITVSNVLIKRLAGEVDGLMAMGFQLLIGGVPLGLLAWVSEKPETTVWSLDFVLILLSLSLLGTSLVYWLWFSVLEKVQLNRANAFSFLIPIFALTMGFSFFGERLGWLEIGGIGLALLGIVLVNRDEVNRG